MDRTRTSDRTRPRPTRRPRRNWRKWAAGAACALFLANTAVAQGKRQKADEEPPPKSRAQISAATQERLQSSLDRLAETLQRDRPDLDPENPGFGALNSNRFLQQVRDYTSLARAFNALSVERLTPWNQRACNELHRRLQTQLAEYATQPWQRDARWWIERFERGLGAAPEDLNGVGRDLNNLAALVTALKERPLLRLRTSSVFHEDMHAQHSGAARRLRERSAPAQLELLELAFERWSGLRSRAADQWDASADDLPQGDRPDLQGAGRLNQGSWTQWIQAHYASAVDADHLELALLAGLRILERFPTPPNGPLDLNTLRAELIGTIPLRTAERLPATQVIFESHPDEPAPRLSWHQQGDQVWIVRRPQLPAWPQGRLAIEGVLLGELAGSLSQACAQRPALLDFQWSSLPDPVGCEALALIMGMSVLEGLDPEEPLALHHLELAACLRERWASALVTLRWHEHREKRLGELLPQFARLARRNDQMLGPDFAALRREPRSALAASLAGLWHADWADLPPKARTQVLEREWLQRIGPEQRAPGPAGPR